ncbi:aminotransferase-like domain-containing protein [Nonomuraea sp. LPB2021202275-12-8]|uniref:aminotransferase-like domain-containing protein n=1 Tax=Nonomuraea sp. LPB2021202275-12-8 TaxID=3120159 RepID=UPI00300D5A1F
MRNPRRLSVPIHLERDLPEPLHHQLAAQLRQAIVTGRLAAGTRMPSTRTLAEVLRISRGVALAAYEILLGEGHVVGRHGSGTYVARREENRARRRPPAEAGLTTVDLTPDRPNPQAFPLIAWRSAWRRASHHAPPDDELPPLGLPELRREITAYLRESRGLVLDDHEVVITAGHEHALGLLLRATGEPSPLVALEDPALPRLRTALSRHARVLPVPVDGDGARAGLVPGGCDAVVVTPERNNPLGARMSPDRRRALAAWASATGGLVVEPAFDGVFDTAANPLPSILSLSDPRRAAMAGSFRDILTPNLRVAFAVVPRHLAEAVEAGVPAASGQPSFTCQRAVTELLASGSVARHVERLSALYATRRKLVRQALGGYARTRLLGTDSGSAAALLLPDPAVADAVTRTLRARRIQVADLATYHQGIPRHGIVLGYGHLDEMTLRRALHVIARTLDTHGLPRSAAA